MARPEGFDLRDDPKDGKYSGIATDWPATPENGPVWAPAVKNSESYRDFLGSMNPSFNPYSSNFRPAHFEMLKGYIDRQRSDSKSITNIAEYHAFLEGLEKIGLRLPFGWRDIPESGLVRLTGDLYGLIREFTK